MKICVFFAIVASKLRNSSFSSSGRSVKQSCRINSLHPCTERKQAKNSRCSKAGSSSRGWRSRPVSSSPTNLIPSPTVFFKLNTFISGVPSSTDKNSRRSYSNSTRKRPPGCFNKPGTAPSSCVTNRNFHTPSFSTHGIIRFVMWLVRNSLASRSRSRSNSSFSLNRCSSGSLYGG
uniref:(northern house mosquito) hypothetical protein n=1 Tax=Culex pipiens TaxID=7175 RepID=A0A8D7ZUQ8_CULPI